MRKTKAVYAELAVHAELAVQSAALLRLAETQRRGRRGEAPSRKGEGCRCALIRGCCPGEAGGGRGAGSSCAIGEGGLFGFL